VYPGAIRWWVQRPHRPIDILSILLVEIQKKILTHAGVDFLNTRIACILLFIQTGILFKRCWRLLLLSSRAVDPGTETTLSLARGDMKVVLNGKHGRGRLWDWSEQKEPRLLIGEAIDTLTSVSRPAHHVPVRVLVVLGYILFAKYPLLLFMHSHHILLFVIIVNAVMCALQVVQGTCWKQ